MKTILILLLILQANMAFTQDITLQTNIRDLGFNERIESPEGISISPSGTVYTTSMRTGKVYASTQPENIPREILDLSKLKGWQKAKNPKALGILAEDDQ